MEPSNFQRYLKYLTFEIFSFSKVCAGRENKETYVPRAPGETVPSSSYIWVTWLTLPRRAAVKMAGNSRIAMRRRAAGCYSSAAGSAPGEGRRHQGSSRGRRQSSLPSKDPKQNEMKNRPTTCMSDLETRPFFSHDTVSHRRLACKNNTATGAKPRRPAPRSQRRTPPSSLSGRRERKKHHAIMCR